jgi:hypothetical protein
MTKQEVLEKNSEKRTKCIVYTRVMGYHRPVESFIIAIQTSKITSNKPNYAGNISYIICCCKFSYIINNFLIPKI